ncbi:hypothetical protein D0810_18840 [Vibrio cholerae]|uniref:HEPN domain-containing protein n=1 Tax=Vibrio cholerae TaxID=666 RepID=UPI000BA98C00|nr:HEPN domain-containing protein [Vibrio cholerae]EGQ7692055.1 hypothetical protein [Vibrio cholerae]EGQ8395120.1 hypothetical protein [Vibrio cholerae]EGQ9579669.1 hypothetical protein [Vibrio cholerae]EGQ9963530.1 hypothetical protein [Vibrio cholerae]EGQ9985084.1 hypothetical protein [Vibrio cholerae]
MSKAYKRFDHTMHRAEAMFGASLAFVQNSNGKISDQHLWVQDSIRASIVIAVSAMDAYFTKKFEEVLVVVLKKGGPKKDLVLRLEKAGLDTRECLLLLNMQRPYRRIRAMVEAYFEKFVTQKFDVIDELYVGFSLKNLSSNAAKKTGYATCLSSIGKLVEKRHQIAHEGDMNKHGKIRKINPQEVQKRFAMLRRFVRAADEIIESKVASIK